MEESHPRGARQRKLYNSTIVGVGKGGGPGDLKERGGRWLLYEQ